MWCIFVCHPHLTIIICRTAVWAQLFGHRHAVRNTKQVFSSSCIIGSFGVLDCFLIPVGVLVGAVSRYCHSWYRLFGPQQPWQIHVRCVLVNTLQYHDTVDFVQDFETEDPHSCSIRGTHGPNLELLDARIASTPKSSRINASRKRSVWRK